MSRSSHILEAMHDFVRGGRHPGQRFLLFDIFEATRAFGIIMTGNQSMDTMVQTLEELDCQDYVEQIAAVEMSTNNGLSWNPDFMLYVVNRDGPRTVRRLIECTRPYNFGTLVEYVVYVCRHGEGSDITILRTMRFTERGSVEQSMRGVSFTLRFPVR